MEVRRYKNKYFIPFALFFWFIFVGTYIYFPSINQCQLCEPIEIIKEIDLKDHFFFAALIFISLIILLKTSLLGGLNPEQRKILGKICKDNGKLKRYQLYKQLKKDKTKSMSDQIVEKPEKYRAKSSIYRIVKKFENYGYVKLDKREIIHITDIGKKFISE